MRWINAPVLGRYYECGRYQGEVAAGATVELQCAVPRPYRYLVVQFPTTNELNFCELEVCVEGEFGS